VGDVNPGGFGPIHSPELQIRALQKVSTGQVSSKSGEQLGRVAGLPALTSKRRSHHPGARRLGVPLLVRGVEHLETDGGETSSSSRPRPESLLRRCEDKLQATGQRNCLEKLGIGGLQLGAGGPATATAIAVPVENQLASASPQPKDSAAIQPATSRAVAPPARRRLGVTSSWSGQTKEPLRQRSLPSTRRRPLRPAPVASEPHAAGRDETAANEPRATWSTSQPSRGYPEAGLTQSGLFRSGNLDQDPFGSRPLWIGAPFGSGPWAIRRLGDRRPSIGASNRRASEKGALRRPPLQPTTIRYRPDLDDLRPAGPSIADRFRFSPLPSGPTPPGRSTAQGRPAAASPAPITAGYTSRTPGCQEPEPYGRTGSIR